MFLNKTSDCNGSVITWTSDKKLYQFQHRYESPAGYITAEKNGNYAIKGVLD